VPIEPPATTVAVMLAGAVPVPAPLLSVIAVPSELTQLVPVPQIVLGGVSDVQKYGRPIVGAGAADSGPDWAARDEPNSARSLENYTYGT
jgi:hypothetical protein